MLKQSSLPQETDTDHILELMRKTGSQEPGSALHHHASNGGWVACLPPSLEPHPASDASKHPTPPALVQWRRARLRRGISEIRGATATAEHEVLNTKNKPAATHQGFSACAADLSRHSCSSLAPTQYSCNRQSLSVSLLSRSSAAPASSSHSHTGTKIIPAKRKAQIGPI